MKKGRCIFLIIILGCLYLKPAGASESSPNEFSLRGGVGTDVGLGVAYGAGLRFFYPMGKGILEFGPDIFFHKSSIETDEGIYTYKETTRLLVFAARINFLSKYDPENPGTYFIFGTGVAAVSVNWEEESATDTSLGTPLPGGGSMQSAEGTAAAWILNFGFGVLLTREVDIRFELPIFIFPGVVGGMSAFAPTITITAGVSF